MAPARQARRRRRGLWALLALAAALGGALGVTGCANLGYYAQAMGGHLELIQRARPVDDWLADEATPAALRERLRLSQRMRRFAVEQLALPDNASYRRYADLQRASVIWNVVATPELSLTLKTWCAPFAGCVGYRGFFARDDADALAAELRGQGLEVGTYGVPAYSTLGWTNWLGGDPLLNTFIAWPEGELARLLFHELAHQVVYVADDTTFNESFATAVERLGGRRWLQQHAGGAASADFDAQSRRRENFRAFAARWRAALREVYDAPLADAAKRERKAAVMAAMRGEYAALRQRDPADGGLAGDARWDAWVARTNNALLAAQGAYDELVPAFERLFEQQGGDFTRFYAEVRRIAALPREQRRATLAALR